MNTEITDTINKHDWVLFDGECRVCRASLRAFGPLLRRHQFELVPLQTPWVRNRLEQCGCELLTEMRLLTQQGIVYGGADALIEIARKIWWAHPICWVAQVPFIRAVLRNIYACIAQRRNCLNGKCQVDNRPAHRRHAFFDMP